VSGTTPFFFFFCDSTSARSAWDPDESTTQDDEPVRFAASQSLNCAPTKHDGRQREDSPGYCVGRAGVNTDPSPCYAYRLIAAADAKDRRYPPTRGCGGARRRGMLAHRLGGSKTCQNASLLLTGVMHHLGAQAAPELGDICGRGTPTPRDLDETQPGGDSFERIVGGSRIITSSIMVNAGAMNRRPLYNQGASGQQRDGLNEFDGPSGPPQPPRAQRVSPSRKSREHGFRRGPVRPSVTKQVRVGPQPRGRKRSSTWF